MGLCQSRKALRKNTVTEENNRITYAASSMQGLHTVMEDAYAAILDLDRFSSTSFFGVYDGHGGANVAMYCANRFHTELVKHEDYQNNLPEALKHVFSRMDELMQDHYQWRVLANLPHVALSLLCCLNAAACVQLEVGVVVPSLLSWRPNAPKFTSRWSLHLGCYHTAEIKETPYMEGSTACVALIRGNQIIVGNVGDSRCVLSRNGQAMDLSTDHKPDLQDERQRIEAAGGQVTRALLSFGSGGIIYGEYRVNGALSISRSIGDFRFKLKEDSAPAEPIVTCTPDIRIVDITPDTEFLLIASDGIWDVMSSQDVVDFVRSKLQCGTDLRIICEHILGDGLKSRDNVTVILVRFNPIIRYLPPALAIADVPSSSANPTLTAGSSNPGAGAEAKTETSMAGGTTPTEITEERSPLLSSSST